MTRRTLAAVPAVISAAILAAILATLISLINVEAVGAQSGSVEARITARKAADGRVELCLYLAAEKDRRCPSARHFPYPTAPINGWLDTSTIEAGRADLVIRGRRTADGWIELALAVTLEGATSIHRPERRFFNWPVVDVDRWLRSSSVSIGTGGGLAAVGIASDAPRLQRGRAAPAFTLAQLEGGGVISLSHLRGRTAALVFWSSWDPAGQTLLRRLDSLRRAQGGARGDLAVLAINVYDAPGAAARAFVEAGVGFQSVLDAGAEVARHYRIDGLPELLLIDADGVFRERITGAADLAAIQAALDATTAAADSAAGRHTGGPLP